MALYALGILNGFDRAQMSTTSSATSSRAVTSWVIPRTSRAPRRWCASTEAKAAWDRASSQASITASMAWRWVGETESRSARRRTISADQIYLSLSDGQFEGDL